jgi:hypothetical protein
MKTYSGLLNNLAPNQIFVFGSNPEGRHGAGAAKVATDHYGAILGRGRGIMGKSYGLVTKNLSRGFVESETGIKYNSAGERSVSKTNILLNIIELYLYAVSKPELEFMIAYTPAPNLNGYSPIEMAELFLSVPVPNNIVLNEELINLYYAYTN